MNSFFLHSKNTIEADENQDNMGMNNEEFIMNNLELRIGNDFLVMSVSLG